MFLITWILLAEVSLRALREIYLRSFELTIRSSNPPWAVMTAYNRLNGLHCSEHRFLLDDVLRKEWNFKGLVVSDWNGTYSSDAAIRAGLDLEMPVCVFICDFSCLLTFAHIQGPTVVRGPALYRALQANKVSQRDIDARVRNVSPYYLLFHSNLTLTCSEQILELINRVQPSGVPENAPEGSLDTPEVRALMREAASVSVIKLNLQGCSTFHMLCI